MRVTETWAAMHEMKLGPDVTFVLNQMLFTYQLECLIVSYPYITYDESVNPQGK
jgi:hypothetical protein